MRDEQPVFGGWVVPSTCDSGTSSPGSSSYRELPDDIRLVVHSYDMCKGSFPFQVERSSFMGLLRHRHIYEWTTLALSVIAYRAPKEAAVQPPCRRTHRLCGTEEDDTTDRPDQFATKNSRLESFLGGTKPTLTFVIPNPNNPVPNIPQLLISHADSPSHFSFCTQLDQPYICRRSSSFFSSFQHDRLYWTAASIRSRCHHPRRTVHHPFL